MTNILTMPSFQTFPATPERPADLIRIAVPRLNKQDRISSYMKQIEARDYDFEWARIDETKVLSCPEWNEFMGNLLDDRDWLSSKGGYGSWAVDGDGIGLSEADTELYRATAYIHVIAAQCAGRTIYVDPQGYNYARYLGFAADGLPEPRTRQEIRREEERIAAQERIAERQRLLENPPEVPADHGLRFFWNGIKTKSGKLERCSYSKGALINHPNEEIITIYAKDYNSFSADIRACFHVTNDSDGYSDYYDNDKLRLLPNHPLYPQVIMAFAAQEEYYAKVQAKREAKWRRQ